MVDALDEAEDPLGIARALAQLTPQTTLRLLVGVRSPSGPDDPLAATGPQGSLADQAEKLLSARRLRADEDPWWHQDDVRGYADSILLHTPGSPYQDPAHHERAGQLATEIAGRVGRTFLVARLAAEALTQRPELADPADPAWLATLDEDVVGVFRADLIRAFPEPRRPARRGRAAAGGRVRLRQGPALGRDLAPGRERRRRPARQVRRPRHRLAACLPDQRLPGHRCRGRHHRVPAVPRRPARCSAYPLARPRWTPHEATNRTRQRSRPRITKTLRALIDDQDLAEHPPAPYLRRHLAEHAAAGRRLNRQVITSQLLPWLDIARLRAIFTTTQPSELRDIALLTRSVTHLWDSQRPDRNAVALSLWAAATGTSSAAPRAQWTTRWTQWRQTPVEILTGHTGRVNAVACTVLPGGQPVAVTGSAMARCGCGTWPPAPPPGSWPATPARRVTRWRARCCPAGGRSRSPAPTMARCGCGTWPPAPPPGTLAGHTGAVRAVACTGAARRAARRGHRLRRWHGAGVGPGHRHPRRGADRPHRPGGRGGVHGAARRAARRGHGSGDGRCGCGTWPPATPAGSCRPHRPGDARWRARCCPAGSPSRSPALRWHGAGVGPGHRHPRRGSWPATPAGAARWRARCCPAGSPSRSPAPHDGTVRVWDLATGTAARDAGRPHRHGERGGVHGAARRAARRGHRLADGTVRVWDLATGTPARELAGHTGPVNAVACTVLPGGQPGRRSPAPTMARCGCGTWPPAPPPAELEPATPARWSRWRARCCPAGSPVAVTGSADGTVRVWDLATGAPARELAGHTSPVTRGGVHGAARRAARRGHRLPRWHGAGVGPGHRHPRPGDWAGHTSAVRAVACTVLPGGQPVAVTGSLDGTVRVWDLATGTPAGELAGHTGAVYAVACTVLPGGQPVAVTGSADRTVRVWDLVARQQLGPELPLPYEATCLAACAEPGGVVFAMDCYLTRLDLTV